MPRCQKVGYPDKAAASAEAKLIRVTRKRFNKKLRAGSPKSNRKLRPYPCPLCGDWHLTSQAPRNKKAAKGR